MTTHTSLRLSVVLVALAGALACSKSTSEPAPVAALPSAKEASPPRSSPQSTAETPAPAPAVETRSMSALPSFAPLVESVKGAVINVEVRAQSREPVATSGPDPFRDFFDRFFSRPGRPQAPPRDQIRSGLGSGFIIDPSGIALTNNHVVQGAIAIRVRLNDGRSFDAEVLGRDPLTDVAVIRFKGDEVKNLPVVHLGDSNSLRVGDWVLAIGNPFGLTSSVSAGILSAKDRVIGAGPYDDFL